MAEENDISFDNFFSLLSSVSGFDYESIQDLWISDLSKDYQPQADSGMIFAQYESFDEFLEQIQELRKKPNKTRWERSALVAVDSSQYATKESTLDWLNKSSTSFDAVKDMTKVIVENVSELINLGGSFKRDRIKVTEDERGIFDFGLASKGLFRPIEFYSEEFRIAINEKKIDNPFEITGNPIGVIPAMGINEIMGSFFYEYKGETYACERRQRGATDVFDNLGTECILKSNSDGIILTYSNVDTSKIYNGKGKHRLKYASSTKKSYLMYDKKADSAKHVDIFIPFNFLGVSDGNRVLNALTPILISSSLENFGVKTRISGLRVGSDNGVLTAISLPLKNYDEPTNEKMNFLLNLLGKESAVDTIVGFGKIYNSNVGTQGVVSGDTSTAFSDVNYNELSYMNNMMSRYKNWVRENKDKPFVNTKVVNENFQFATASLRSRRNRLPFFGRDTKSNKASIVENIKYVFFMFYFYMDFLAVEINTIEDFVKMVYKRFNEDEAFRKMYKLPKSFAQKKNLLDKYVRSILLLKYKPVTYGEYKDTKEQSKQKDEAFTEKIRGVESAIKAL